MKKHPRTRAYLSMVAISGALLATGFTATACSQDATESANDDTVATTEAADGTSDATAEEATDSAASDSADSSESEEEADPMEKVRTVADEAGLTEENADLFTELYTIVNSERVAEGASELHPCPGATKHAMADALGQVNGESYTYPADGNFTVAKYTGPHATAQDIVAGWVSTDEGKEALLADGTMLGIGVATANDGGIIVVRAIH